MGLFTKNSSGPGDSFFYAGKPVTCSHCGSAYFKKSKALLNTRGATFFDFDWANKGAIILICASCGHIEWFASDPD